ncbi:MAG: hydrogenase maturation nickel metallochaperone HypA [Marinilabiliales bacterium]|nr:hydrogenase maturation nickel metallochaperone HypA [Marinilabiliales bacterium]
MQQEAGDSWICRQGSCCREYAEETAMHELRIAEELAAMVAGYAAEAGLTTVDRVNVSFGQFIQIVPDLFEAAFREAARDTRCSLSGTRH